MAYSSATNAFALCRPATAIGAELARRGVDMILAVEDGNALIQCQVSSAVAARMLAPLKNKAVGQFRPLSHGVVEIDAMVTLAAAVKMLEAGKAAVSDAALLH